MGYTAWSLVYGEQPSTAKWNILGNNDAGFVDMSGLPSAVKAVNRQNITTDAAVTNQLIQQGWGFKVGDDVNRYITEAVTFPVAYDSAPVVICTYIGALADVDPTSVADLTTGGTTIRGCCNAISTTGFTALVIRASIDGAAPLVFASATRYGYTWIAVGTKAR